jgi:glutamate 5-kinase
MIDKTYNRISDARRLVVKIGSALLVEDARGTLHRAWLESLIEDVVQCAKRGQQIVLVSSGAIALGRRHLQFKTGVLKLNDTVLVIMID